MSFGDGVSLPLLPVWLSARLWIVHRFWLQSKPLRRMLRETQHPFCHPRHYIYSCMKRSILLFQKGYTRWRRAQGYRLLLEPCRFPPFFLSRVLERLGFQFMHGGITGTSITLYARASASIRIWKTQIPNERRDYGRCSWMVEVKPEQQHWPYYCKECLMCQIICYSVHFNERVQYWTSLLVPFSCFYTRWKPFFLSYAFCKAIVTSYRTPGLGCATICLFWSSSILMRMPRARSRWIGS